MNISNETIAVLQNFATINNGLQVKAGNVLQTISPGKTVVAIAVVAETFEDFCVYAQTAGGRVEAAGRRSGRARTKRAGSTGSSGGGEAEAASRVEARASTAV